MNDKPTVRECRNVRDTEQCTEPCPPPNESDTWPSPGHDDTDCNHGAPTEVLVRTKSDVVPTVSPLDIALALRHPPLPSEWYELAGVDLAEVAA